MPDRSVNSKKAIPNTSVVKDSCCCPSDIGLALDPPNLKVGLFRDGGKAAPNITRVVADGHYTAVTTLGHNQGF